MSLTDDEKVAVVWYKKLFPYLKDIAYVIGLVYSVYTVYEGKLENAAEKAKVEATKEANEKYRDAEMVKFEEFMSKQGDLNQKQAEINGGVIQFLKSK